MEFDGTIVLGHHYLAVIFRKDLELDHFAIHTSEALQGEFSSIINLYLRGVNAGSDDVSLILGDFHLVGRDLKLKILDEFDPPSILLIVAQRFAVFLGLRQKLRV